MTYITALAAIGPVFIFLMVSVWFGALSAIRRKEKAITFLFIAVALQLIGTVCTSFGYSAAAAAIGSNSAAQVSFVKSLLATGKYAMVLAGLIATVGWILLSRRRKNA